MEQLVVVRKEPSGRFVAQAVAVPGVRGESESEEGAIAQVREALTSWFAGGKLVRVTVPSSQTGNPWVDNFGLFANDPQFDDFVEELKQARSAADQQP